MSFHIDPNDEPEQLDPETLRQAICHLGRCGTCSALLPTLWVFKTRPEGVPDPVIRHNCARNRWVTDRKLQWRRYGDHEDRERERHNRVYDFDD